MASFQKYTTKNGQMWMYKIDTNIHPDTGKRQTTTRRGFKTKKEAQVSAAIMEQEITSGILINNMALTFQDVYEEWFVNHSKTIKISSRKSLESKFNKHILPRFGKLKIKEITRVYCQKVMNEVADILLVPNDIKIQINQVFKFAIKMDLISKNPMDHVSVPRRSKEMLKNESDTVNRNYWSKEEIKNFLEITKTNLSLRDHSLFHLLIFTGARKGELLALSWDDIDFVAGSIRLNKTLFHTDKKFIIQTSKTNESNRLISLDINTLSLLKKWRRGQREANLAIPLHIHQNNMVFTREDGSPLRLAYLNEKLDTLIKKHNLHRINIHGFRHSHASLLFEAGASIKEVQERLGHSDIQMTMNIYTHVTDTVKEQTAQKFQKYMDI